MLLTTSKKHYASFQLQSVFNMLSLSKLILDVNYKLVSKNFKRKVVFFEDSCYCLTISLNKNELSRSEVL